MSNAPATRRNEREQNSSVNHILPTRISRSWLVMKTSTIPKLGNLQEVSR
jgi:hypothetical protein